MDGRQADLAREEAQGSVDQGRAQGRTLHSAGLAHHADAPDGRVTTCFIIDVSPAGVAVSSEVQPPIGMPLAVGSCVGRVVRIFETGFAVKFVEKQNLNDLSRLIVRIEQTASGSSQLAEAMP